jgi:hypothetical protein
MSDRFATSGLRWILERSHICMRLSSLAEPDFGDEIPEISPLFSGSLNNNVGRDKVEGAWQH